MDAPYNFNLERDELQSALGKGIPSGSIVLIEGDEGTGKSLIAQRMAYGFLANGHSVTIVSTELTIKGFINQMYSLGYPVATHLLSERLLYVPVYQLLSDSLVTGDFLGRLMCGKELFRNDVVFIDTLSAMIMNSGNGFGKSQFLIPMLERLAGLGKTIFLAVDNNHLNGSSLESSSRRLE